jgi:hypothetical protein
MHNTKLCVKIGRPVSYPESLKLVFQGHIQILSTLFALNVSRKYRQKSRITTSLTISEASISKQLAQHCSWNGTYGIKQWKMYEYGVKIDKEVFNPLHNKFNAFLLQKNNEIIMCHSFHGVVCVCLTQTAGLHYPNNRTHSPEPVQSISQLHHQIH